MPSFLRNIFLLRLACIGFIFFGLGLAFFNQTALLQAVLGPYINKVFWNTLTPEGGVVMFQRFVFGIIGATCVMSGILFVCIINNALVHRKRWAWRAMALATLGWFIIDQTLSLYFTVYGNVVLNLILLCTMFIPLLLIQKDCTE